MRAIRLALKMYTQPFRKSFDDLLPNRQLVNLILVSIDPYAAPIVALERLPIVSAGVSNCSGEANYVTQLLCPDWSAWEAGMGYN